MKKIIVILAVLVAAFSLSAAVFAQRTVVDVKGSDTMVMLTQALAEAYQKANANNFVTVSGGGSGVGIAALLNKSIDIATSSRPMTAAELETAKKNGVAAKEVKVALDGVCIIIHKSNGVKNLTTQQLADIYTGKITNWKQVGGKDLKIVALSRDKSSGTYAFMLEHILRGGNSKGTEEYAKSVLMLASSNAIATEVAKNKAAIGYVGLGYADLKKHNEIAIAAKGSTKYILPSAKTILDNSYPISRPLFFYLKENNNAAANKFVDYVLSAAGQKIVEAQEFVPINKK